MKMAPIGVALLAVLAVLAGHAGATSTCQTANSVTLGNYGACSTTDRTLKSHADIGGTVQALKAGETLTCTSTVMLSSADCGAGSCGTIYYTQTVVSPPITTNSPQASNTAYCPQFPSNPPAGCGTLGYSSIDLANAPGFDCKGFLTWTVNKCTVSPSGSEATYNIASFQIGANLFVTSTGALQGGFDGGGGSNYGGSNSCTQQASGSITADPHFVTNGFDFFFSGDAESSYCLLSDANLHINSRLVGEREDAPVNTEGTEKGTWMDMIHVIFSKPGGTEHSLTVMIDQEKEFEVQDCFDFELDGEFIAVPSSSSEVVFVSETTPQVTIIRRAGQRAATEIDIEGIGSIDFEIDIDDRIQVEPSGKYLNMYVTDLTVTNDVHGILGQFFAKGAGAKKNTLWNKLDPEDINHRDMVEGDDNQYLATSLTTADCPVSRYAAPKPEVAIRRMMLTKKDAPLETTQMTCLVTGNGIRCD